MTDIQPFRIAVPDADLDDLRTRLARTRWPSAPYGATPSDATDGQPEDWSRGVPPAYLRDLVDHWATGYDWRAQEAALNEIPQFVTEIEGQTVHFLHARSPEPDAMPLLLTHGWPSSPFEFARLVGPLTDPRRHGGSPEDAFHVVAPSLPGYGFSNPIGPGGFNLFGVARMWAELMTRLGFEKYVAHGTDVGSGVAGMLPLLDPRVVGVHLTGTAAGTPFGPPLDPDSVPAADRDRAERFNTFREEGTGYLAIQQTRPQTLAYALNDSPVGQAAWIVEKFHEWTDPAAALPDDAVGRDVLLTAVSLFWFTGSGASSAHAVYDGMQAWKAMASQADGHGGAAAFDAPPGPPTGVAVFAADTTIRSVMDPAGTIAHWSEHDRGGHFPGLEVPELLTEDIRDFTRRMR
jgi:pimeloyl-ACP methyl ester carboxylesterase